MNTRAPGTLEKVGREELADAGMEVEDVRSDIAGSGEIRLG